MLKYVGAGGMGAVFYAMSPLKGPLAVKILKPDIVAKFPQYAELFSREIAAVRSLVHPNIVRFVGDGKMIAGIPFLVVDWLEGETLDQHLGSNLPPRKVLSLFEQIGAALAFAHRQKIIHLDIKPENIFLVPNKHGAGESVKVIDFGLSRILSTYSGTTVTRFAGSLHYCSPEHFGGKVSPRSDIFSLGVLLHHMLTGLLPIGASYIAAKQGGGELPKLPRLVGLESTISDALEQVTEQATRRDPDERYQSVEELLNSLRLALDPLTKNEASSSIDDISEDSNHIAVESVIRSEVKVWLRQEFSSLNSVLTKLEDEAITLYGAYKSDFVIYRQEWQEPKKLLSGVIVLVDGHHDLRSIMRELAKHIDSQLTLIVVFRQATKASAVGQELSAIVSANRHITVVAGWYSALDNHFHSILVPTALHELLYFPY
ncbi:MAG TPA: serine/threonine-protein kinase [Pyrinomonadaceae bacterium]|nr:serine/threonine-protein kinase [Pyrinomonadaceae bacterium]